MKEFKCKNCGSSKYIQIKEDKYKCAYCEAEFDIVSAEKDIFEFNLSGQAFKKSIKFLSANVSEDEFYKNVLIQLSMNKNSPSDILEKCKFEFVKYRYVFFAVCDIEYYEIEKSSMYSVDAKTANLSYSHTSNCVAEIQKGMVLTQDCFSEQAGLVLKGLEEGLVQNSSLTSVPNKETKVNAPSKAEVEKAVKNAADSLKSKVQNDCASGELTSKIVNVQLYAIPEYSIEYKYGNEKYTLYSYAHSLNIVGSLPNLKDYREQENKSLKPVNIIFSIVCLLISAFSLSHLIFFRLYKFLALDIILFLGSIGILLLNLGINWVLIRKLKKEILKEKKEKLLNYMSKKDIKPNLNDEELINSFLRRY